jgi:hypothetical protein
MVLKMKKENPKEDTRMIAERNHEYLAAGLRQQIESLAHMIEEVQLDQLNEEAVSWRLRAVEIGLRRLRGPLSYS